MKELIMQFINKYKKYVILTGSGLGLILIGVISWNLIFVKYYDFAQKEKKFIKAAERYYEFHKQFLPKKNESKDLTLQDLYDLDQLDDLYVPKSRKMCDVNNSWVRVFNNNGEYEYYSYLKCGKYQSRTDHEGPEITLKGESKIVVALGSTFEDPGIKKVIDNKDGEIDIKNVVIDSSNLNTNKIGNYTITYTVKDSHYNKTIITRKITVSKGLTDTVKATANPNGYYIGTSDNYVLFSGMLWRIVKVNEDGTVKIILNESTANLRANYEKYKDSNIDTWLNKVFYKALKGTNKYIVNTDYCVGNINSMNDYSNYCSETIKSKVGLLDINDYLNTFGGNASSIIAKSFMLSHKIGNNYADGTFDDTKPDGTDSAILAPIRPVITLTNDLSILSGNGTYKNPYKLNDYSYANKTDKINTRLIGEYIEYSGLIFRINNVDKDKNVQLILAGEWIVKPNDTSLYISTDKIDEWKFDLEDENNPAYLMNNDYLDYINTKNIVTTEYEIPTNDPSVKYNKYKTKKVKAKIVLPKTYDLFSSAGDAKYVYAYLDNSTNKNLLFMANTANGKVFELGKNDFNTYSLKIVLTIKGDLRIESGKGTVNSPYKLK